MHSRVVKSCLETLEQGALFLNRQPIPDSFGFWFNILTGTEANMARAYSLDARERIGAAVSADGRSRG